MREKQVRIKVPCSTSNIGPGFDSIGIALNLYLIIECYPNEEWVFIQKDKDFQHLPKGKDNMLYEMAIKVAHRFGFTALPPYKVEVLSEIPIARGLGSSGAITVAAIELVNQILGLELTLDEKVKIAADMEGHPDNVAPSFLGGCVVAYYRENELYYVNKKKMDSIEFVAMIPNFELRTKVARDVLPKELPFVKSIEGSAIGNVCTAAIFQENYALLGEVLEKELFHQPYRKQFIPHFDELTAFMKKEGAYGTFLSGAGPTMISIMEKGLAANKMKQWKERFTEAEFQILQVEETGVQIKTIETIGPKK